MGTNTTGKPVDLRAQEIFAKSKSLAKECVDYLTTCVTPYHCVAETARLLLSSGFEKLSEKVSWDCKLQRGGKYFVVRNGSSLVAFTIGAACDLSKGVKLIGAHTDSPNIQLKPVAACTKSGYEGVQVQLYGGGLWHTWFDRDLGLAGKIIYRKENPSVPDATNKSGAVTAPSWTLHSKLIHIAQPILRIPTLAIHLSEADERTQFAPHKENHIAPIFATSLIQEICGKDAVADQKIIDAKKAEENRIRKRNERKEKKQKEKKERKRKEEEVRKRKEEERQRRYYGYEYESAISIDEIQNSKDDDDDDDEGEDEIEDVVKRETYESTSRCSALLAQRLLEAAGEDPLKTVLVDFHLSLVDAAPPTLGGMHDEFVFSGRIDNLLSCFASVRALLDAAETGSDPRVRMVALFDHEEVGSCSPEGADSSFIPDMFQRFLSAKSIHCDPVASPRAPEFHANSFFISADGAHAVHPNYADRHQSTHAPKIQAGIVIKNNANLRYATDVRTATIIRELARKRGIPLQEFCVKNNSPCGSTIGPMLSAMTGVPTVDIGAPMLSMHSIREMCGIVDMWYLKELLHEFLSTTELVEILEN